MKKLILLFIICSVAAQAQIVQYVNISGGEQNFYKLGGYSYTEQSFPAGVQATPYTRIGPSPQNDFQYVATATGGIKNLNNAISTVNVGTGITLKMKNNNIRKFGANVLSKTPDGLSTTTNVMILSVFTNQGNGQSYIFSNSSITWMGLVATGQNEYIDSVKVSYASASSNVITIGNIMVGDDQAQNVSLNFDGFDDFVSIPSAIGNFDYNQAFTVSCWVKPDALQPGGSLDVAILEKWDQTGSYPFVIRYLKGADAGKIRVARYDGFNNPAINSTVLINDGKWHHIALTTLGSSGLMKLYIDGNLQAQVNDITNSTTINVSQLYIGQRGNGINRFKGEIDEVRIWNIAKNQTDIQNEMYCKNPNTTNLQAAYNFNNGVPHSNNSLLTQIPDAAGIGTHGTLNNFTKTGDASNFVTGQVKYVSSDAPGGNNGSSWANAFTNLQSALTANTCNDLFDVYVATNTYKPAAPNGDVNTSFFIPMGMRIYGGFAGTETNINQRNLALIHSTNKTTLSGDLNGDDTPFIFTTNRTDNSFYPVFITGNNVVFDGFTVIGSSNSGAGIFTVGTNVTIKNSRVIDNAGYGLYILGGNATIANCSIMGNKSNGIYTSNNSTNFENCVIVNNGGNGIFQIAHENEQTKLLNCTIAANGGNGMANQVDEFFGINNTIKNTIIKDNAGDGIVDIDVGVTTNNITYSLVQGVTSGTGNLDGNMVNPQFMSLLANSIVNITGDYRLKWCSFAINAGTNTGISPLDLDRKPRNFNTTADMGAYEFLGNTPSQVAISNITGTIDSPTYAGGAIQTITSTAKILAPAGAIDFKAPNAIILNPGFEARGVGQYFKAEIGANVGCVNP